MIFRYATLSGGKMDSFPGMSENDLSMNDNTVIKLGYRKTLWFASVLQIKCSDTNY